MIVVKTNLHDGACNFCRRGIMKNDKIIFPYSHVWRIERDSESSLSARLCDDCLKELKQKAN